MMTRNDGRPSLMESLESRTLRSVSVMDTPTTDPGTGGGTTPPPADCVSAETIAADRQKIQDDLAKLATDRAACEQLIQQKRDALNAARQALEAQAAPLRQKLATDRTACEQTLQADRTAIQNASRDGLKLIFADVKAAMAARRDPVALNAALDKLAADRQALQTTLAPLLEKLQKDATDCATLLAADQKAIDDLFNNDPTVKAAQDALAAAQKECADKIAADTATLRTDRDKLQDDLAHRCDGEDHDGDGDHDDDDHQDDDDHDDDDDDDDDHHDDSDDDDDDHQGDDNNQGDGHHEGDDNQGHTVREEFIRRAALRLSSPFAG